jgi:hypothetical protein
MKASIHTYRFSVLALVLAIAVAMTGCLGGIGESDELPGSGGPAAGGAAGTTGSVALLITDAPTSDFDEINLAITGASLIGADDGDPVPIFSGYRKINLLELQDHSELFSLTDVPAGTYEKIRLEVRDIELVRLDEAGDPVEVIRPMLPSGKIDLNPRRTFEVKGGETLILQVDIDAQKSVHVVSAGRSGLTIFRPVVFVDIIDGLKARFTKVNGTIAEIDDEARTFVLCGAFRDCGADAGDGDERCLTILVGDDTSIFNADGAATFDAIIVGDPATVIGRLRHYEEGAALNARFVWLGEHDALVRVRGVVTTGYNGESGRFEVEVARSGVFATGDLIDVGVVDGVRVLSRSGLDLGPQDIAAGLEARILGILTGDEPEVMALVVFLADDALPTVRLSGTVGTIDPDAGTFMLLPSVDGNISADTLICVGADTSIHIISGMSSNAATLGELVSDQTADVYGYGFSGGCFQAKNVIAFALPEPVPEL